MNGRAVVATGIVLVALASGCGGGGADGTAPRPAAAPSSQGSAATTTPQASDGRLGGALVARPGGTTNKGGAGEITGRSILPPPAKHGVGAEDNCANQDLQPTQG